MSYTIYKSTSGLVAQAGRTVSTFHSGLVRVEQSYLGLTAAAAANRAALAVGNNMPDGDSSPCIDGLKIFPEVQEVRREDGFTEYQVCAYGRSNTNGKSYLLPAGKALPPLRFPSPYYVNSIFQTNGLVLNFQFLFGTYVTEKALKGGLVVPSADPATFPAVPTLSASVNTALTQPFPDFSNDNGSTVPVVQSLVCDLFSKTLQNEKWRYTFEVTATFSTSHAYTFPSGFGTKINIVPGVPHKIGRLSLDFSPKDLDQSTRFFGAFFEHTISQNFDFVSYASEACATTGTPFTPNFPNQ